MKRTYIGIAAVVIAAVGIFAGATNLDLKLGRSIETLVNIMRDVRLYYVDETDPEQMLKNAAEGLSKGLDPYTVWMPAEDMDDFALMTTGKYGGIGSVIRKSGDHVVVAAPYRDSPADKAGLIAGDKFIEIGGENVEGKTTEYVTTLLKGDAGTSFEVIVEKLITGQRETVTITREQIRIPSVPYYALLDSGMGYIRHSDFSDGSAGEVRKAVVDLKKQGARGLILDYRGNGGGILQEAVKVLSLFVPRGTEVVTTKGRNPRANESYRTAQEPLDLEIPMTVLVDRNSASASEIVAGALQDLGRAKLLGQKSFGKGLVQMTRPVGYGSYIKITTSRYYLPSGRTIDSIGVAPDIELTPEYMSLFTAIVYGRGYIGDFCDDFSRRNPGITEFDYNEFVGWMRDKEVPYRSDTRLALEALRERAERELFMDEIGPDITHIEQNLRDDKDGSLMRYRKELSEMITEELLTRRGYQRAALEYQTAHDPEVARAVEYLKNEALADI